ncbi:hypothetical protein KGF57_004441 [Candida theae]|uniref:Uncharacterized protein n=1 Tax=Candida theae TaxID=1198502 RepID=A0AAD5FX01_9ASCO|nr:uncharacterized protein KGF57_004441 [Candida theae]KAI5950095.1 hypothetical protein KGF57_004441 [Candida theae]
MATSTTITKKKKLVYKQDSDGVFRLKKVDDGSRSDNSSIDTIDYLRRKDKVDKYLNELMDCSYTIDGEPATPHGAQSTVTRPRAKTTPHQINTNSQLGNCKQTEKISDKPHIDKARAYSSPITTTTTTATSSHFSLPSTRHSMESYTSQQLSQDTNWMAHLSDNQYEFKSFHIPSFALGVILTVIAAVFKEQLTRFTLGLAVFGIVLVLLAICAVAAAVYSGLIKQEDINVLNLFSKNLQDSPQPPDVTNEYRKRDDISDIIQHYTERNGRRKSRDSLTPSLGGDTRQSSPSAKGRRSVINVRPYISDRTAVNSSSSLLNNNNNNNNNNNSSSSNHNKTQRQIKPNYTLENSSSPQLNNDSHDPLHNLPALSRVNTDPTQFTRNKRKSSFPPYPVDTVRRPRLDSAQTLTSVKNLPSLPSDELPFINEVKLIDTFEQQARYDSQYADSIASSSTNDRRAGRDSSLTRQRSILGTTANYEKFIANVGH